MRTISLLTFCAWIVLGFAGCGGNGAGNDAQADLDRANTASGRNSSVRTTELPTNSQNSVNIRPTSNGVEDLGPTARNSKLDTIRRSGNALPPEDIDLEAILKRSTRPAPENSTFSAALTNVVFERRTFLDHPILAKVEKVIDGDRSSLRVFTRNGRTINLPADAIENLSIISSAAILQAARLEMPQTKPLDRKPGATDRN